MTRLLLRAGMLCFFGGVVSYVHATELASLLMVQCNNVFTFDQPARCRQPLVYAWVGIVISAGGITLLVAATVMWLFRRGGTGRAG